MEENQNLRELQNKLNELIEANKKLRDDIYFQSLEIDRLSTQVNSVAPGKEEKIIPPVLNSQPPQPDSFIKTPEPVKQPPEIKTPFIETSSFAGFQLEKFIGENLINKIGIVVIILGVVIGAKYSIEHNLITPLTRILTGYLTGVILAAVAFKLKKNYHNFSAVLLSGAMAVFYFDTFVAYGFYGLFSRLAAFAIMVFFTAFTVTAAIKYNRQVIAHIGLVGAYAVPFLLNDNSGRADLLFMYTAIINAGILFIAFRRYWKPLYYSSFAVTWIIYLAWLTSEYNVNTYFLTAITFGALFFAGFYTMFLIYKLIRKEVFQPDDVFIFLINAFVFYGSGYFLLTTNPASAELPGLFTFINAIVHAVVCYLIVRGKLADRRLFLIALTIVIVFITVTIPVQLDGNWVTLCWSILAATLFGVAVKSDQKLFEKYTLPIILLAAGSMFHDWVSYGQLQNGSVPFMHAVPFFNPNFLTALIFNLSLGFIIYNHQFLKPEKLTTAESDIRSITSNIVIFTLAAGTWFMIIYEISMSFEHWISSSTIMISKLQGNNYQHFYDRSIPDLRIVVFFCFSLFYLALISWGNKKYLEVQNLFKTLRVLNPLVIWMSLIIGLNFTFSLQENYIHPSHPEFFNHIIEILIRYIMVFLAGVLAYYEFKIVRPSIEKKHQLIIFDMIMMFAGIYYLCSEFIYLLKFFESSFTSKGITILLAVYAAVFIWLGIKKNLIHIRVGAFIIFSITLIKLFLFDISAVTTITKTIMFIIVGAILLISSFLYNKFKSRMD